MSWWRESTWQEKAMWGWLAATVAWLLYNLIDFEGWNLVVTPALVAIGAVLLVMDQVQRRKRKNRH